MIITTTGDFFGYLKDPATYHQVYRNAELQQAISHVYGFTAAFAIPFQLAGWRTTQNSRIAIAVFLLQVCFGQVEDRFNRTLLRVSLVGPSDFPVILTVTSRNRYKGW